MRTRSASRAWLAGAGLAILLAQAAAGSGADVKTGGGSGSGSDVATAGGSGPDVKKVAGKAVSVENVKHFQSAASGSFQLGSEIEIDFTKGWPELGDDGGKCNQAALYLDGVRLEGQELIACDPAAGSLVYRLDRADAAAARTWNAVLADPPARLVGVSVGVKGSPPIDSTLKETFCVNQLVWYGYGPAVVLLLLVLLASRHGLLRDAVPDQTNVQDRPYSLARCQLAGWLVLLVGAFFLVWISSGEIPVMTPQVLALLGITGGTTLTSQALNSSANTRRIAAANQAAAPKHRDFVSDILSENGAVSITRLQHAVWTVVVWAVFVVSVYKVFGLLDLDKTLLGLTGISSLTYGAAKTTEAPKS